MEELEWACDVKTAINGTESRRSLRINPTVNLVFSYPANKQDLADAQTLISLNSGAWWVPLWHLAYLTGERPMTATNATFTFTDASAAIWHGFEAAGGHCLVYDSRSAREYSLHAYTLAANVLTVTGTITPSLSEYLSIAALRPANVISERSIDGEVGTLEVLQIEYALDQPLAGAAPTAFPSVDGYDILDWETLGASPLAGEESEHGIWYKVGGRSWVRNLKQPVITQQFGWSGTIDEDNAAYPADDIHQFRAWLWQRQGCTKAFIRNSFRRDITNIASMTATAITLDAAMLEEMKTYITALMPYIALVPPGRALGASTPSRTYHKVSGVSNGDMTIDIDASTPVSTTATIGWIELCYLARLASDQVTFDWQAHGNVDTQISMVSFPIVTTSSTEAAAIAAAKTQTLGEVLT